MRKLPLLGARKHHAPIIDRPERVPRRQRLLLGTLTAVLWAVWLYLWSPLLTLLFWLLGVFLGWRAIAPMLLQGNVLRSLVSLIGLAAILGLLLVLWATLEYLRFRNASRRTWTSPVTPAELASSELTHTGLSEEQIRRWQQARCLYVQHDDDGRVSGAQSPG